MSAFVGLRRVSRLADGAHRSIPLHLEVVVVADTRDAPALFVDIEKGFALEGLQVLHQGVQLVRGVDIVGKEDDAAHGILRVHFLHLWRHLL